MSFPPSYVQREIKFPGTIAQGATGMKARRVQEWATFHGFGTPIDEEFGDATETVVERFQAAKELPVTGRVGEATWTLLAKPMADAMSATIAAADSTVDRAVLKLARAHLKQHPIELGGDNKGPWVRAYVGGNQGAEWKWCAGFLSLVLKQACSLLNVTMPISGSVSCDSLAAQARERERFVRGTLLANGSVTWPDLGQCSIFLVRNTSTDWTHAGFAFAGENTVFSTVEANTNDEGSANGYEVCQRTRSISGKDFIRII